MPKPPTKQQRKNMNWFIPLLFGAAAMLIMFAAYLKSPTHEHYNPENPNKAKVTYSDTASVSILPEEEDAPKENSSKDAEKKKVTFAREHSDLAAQWAMAHYTFVGLVIGVIGICFIIWTIIETRGAAYFAEQTLAETKESSKRQIRAYLNIEVIALNLNDCGDTPTIKFKIINRGASPAIKIRYNIKGLGADEHTDWNVTVLPNSSEEIYWPLEGLDISKDSELEYFRLKLGYSDIFNGNRWIHCKFYIGKETFPRTENIIRETTGLFDVAQGAEKRTTLIANPSHVPEKKVQFSFYNDDLQKEAEEYAKANKPT